jgi:hypothetical protein
MTKDHPPDDGAGADPFLKRARWSRSTAGSVQIFGGVWAIFGHGNVAGIGEALYAGARRAADLSRAQRAGHGACRHRLCQGEFPPAFHGLHDLDRPGRAPTW